MWIKIVEKCRAQDQAFTTGQLAEVGDPVGEQLIRIGRAIPAEAPEQKKLSRKRKSDDD
jgi:hypothetical protein